MIRNTKYFILTAIAFAAAVSCVKSPDLPMQILNVDKEVVIAPAIGSDYVIAVETNTSCKISLDNASWIIPSSEEFVGTASLTFTVEPNSGEERIAAVIVETADKSISKEIKFIQYSREEDGYISIKSLRALEKPGESLTISGNPAKIKGFVTTDPVSSNWLAGSFSIQDSFTESMSGLNIAPKSDGFMFEYCEEVEIALEGSVLARNADGYLTLTPASLPARRETTPITMKPVELGYEELCGGEYESMLVTAMEFQVVEASIGSVLGVSPLFENKDGRRIEVCVSDNAPFANETFDQGVGNVSGILGPASETPEIHLMSVAGLDLSAMRIGVLPGIRQLPYIFSFYCSEQTNETPKYLTYHKLTWNASTKLVKGVVAEEKDVSVGAYLELTSYGKEAGNIANGGTCFWAEGGAHDNVNVSGFVSLDCKTTPPEECGFYLTVPLQMDMPSDFNVSFGFAGAEWALRYWHVYYSADKQTWYEALEHVAIDEICSGGSYYLYFTVPVHLEIPLSEGTNLYLKFVPKGGTGVGGSETADGHGASCYIRMHSAIVLSQEIEGNTSCPAGAVYFEPFDRLTAGMDYFLGDRLGAFANYCADDISSWSEGQKNGLTGTNVRERPGYAQIGYVDTERSGNRNTYVNEPGALTTPALGTAGDFTLSFKAAAYITPAATRPNSGGAPDVRTPDITSIVVEVLNGGTIDGKTSIDVGSLSTSEFGTYTFELKGATAGTRIRFTSDQAKGEFTRWFIDDILVL